MKALRGKELEVASWILRRIALPLVLVGTTTLAVMAEPLELQPGGPARALRLPIEELGAQGSIEVEAAWSTDAGADPDGNIWVQIVKESDSGFSAVEAVDASRGDALYLMAQAGEDARRQQIQGVVAFRKAGEILAHGPFTIEVRPPPALVPVSLWAGAFCAVVVFMVAGMVLNTRLLPSPRRLAAHFRPVQANVLRQAALTKELERALSPKQRWLAWRRSKPFAFMMPGRLYREALRLAPEGAHRLNPALVHDSNVVRRLDQGVEQWRGALYAVATPWKGVEILAVPNRRNRVGKLLLDRTRQEPWFRLTKSQELLPEGDPPAGGNLGLKVMP